MKNNNDDKVSIVVVNFNSGAYLERCLRSLLCSDISLEICVVDNCSSDSSFEKIQTLKNRIEKDTHSLIEIRNEKNLGFSCAVNIGTAATHSDYLLVLNPDCFVHPHTVRLLRDALISSNNAGIVGPLVFNENGTEQVGCRRNEPTLYRSAVKALGLSRWFNGVDLRYKPIPNEIVRVDAVSGCAMMFRRDRFDKIGGMDERYFLHCEDLDVCRRMRDSGHDVCFVPTVSLFHQQGVSGGASNQLIEHLKHEGMMTYYLEHYGRNKSFAVLLVKFFVFLHLWVKKTRSFIKEKVINHHSSRYEENQIDEYLADLPSPNMPPILLITGANSDVGDFFLQRLNEKGINSIAVFRSSKRDRNCSNISWFSNEYFEKVPAQDMPLFEQWVNLAPIWTTERFLKFFKRSLPKKIVALGSTSIDAKSSSENVHEQKVVSMLKQGEKILMDVANMHKVETVILRPTMIYGGPRNKNVNLIERIIKKIKIFPIVGDANGKRQPVHADDVAAAVYLSLTGTSVQGIYSIAGAEALSFRELVVRIFESVGQTPRFLKCPQHILKGVLSIVSYIPLFKGLSPGLVTRLQTDQVFSNNKAIEEFGYAPRDFQPKRENSKELK